MLKSLPENSGSIRYGVDRIVNSEVCLPSDLRYGLVTNDGAVTARQPALPGRQALMDAGVTLVRLFAPEHGITAVAADGAAVPDGVDPLTGLEVISLYGDRLRPPHDKLVDLDGVLLDLPDVGARFYTFIWTMSHVLEACAEAGIPLWILDRPNPISGDLTAAEGPMLDEAHCASFVGRYAIPVRHCLTMGELARFFNESRRLGATVHVVSTAGWKRADHQPASGLAFVPPSPAMPSYESALLYPGICLFEATNVSLGRGTDCPFQQIGAPWMDGAALEVALNGLGLPGVVAHRTEFTPQEEPYRRQHCQGIRLQITDRATLRPVALGLHFLGLVARQYARDFAWSPYPTAVSPEGRHHFERLIGRREIADALTSDPVLAARIEVWTAVPGWAGQISRYLCYP